jgi:dGTPase
MLSGIALWEMITEGLGLDWRTLDDLTRHEIIRELIGVEITHMVNDSNRRIEASGVKSLHELQSLPYNVIGFDEDMRKKNDELKSFLFQNMYRQYRVVRMQKKAERVLTELFNAYLEEPNMLPRQFQELIEIKGRERTVCDYLAGMTDRFAVDEYQKLFDPSLLP